jgi:hypothetical protein
MITEFDRQISLGLFSPSWAKKDLQKFAATLSRNQSAAD